MDPYIVISAAGGIQERQFEPNEDAYFEFRIMNNTANVTLNNLRVVSSEVIGGPDQETIDEIRVNETTFTPASIEPQGISIVRTRLTSEDATPDPSYELHLTLGWDTEVYQPQPQQETQHTFAVVAD